jgi:hypothetical protein
MDADAVPEGSLPSAQGRSANHCIGSRPGCGRWIRRCRFVDAVTPPRVCPAGRAPAGHRCTGRACGRCIAPAMGDGRCEFLQVHRCPSAPERAPPGGIRRGDAPAMGDGRCKFLQISVPAAHGRRMPEARAALPTIVFPAREGALTMSASYFGVSPRRGELALPLRIFVQVPSLAPSGSFGSVGVATWGMPPCILDGLWRRPAIPACLSVLVPIASLVGMPRLAVAVRWQGRVPAFPSDLDPLRNDDIF